MSTTYDTAAKDGKGLRGAISNALSGITSIFGRDSTDEAAAEETKVIGTWTKELDLAESFFRDYQKDALDTVSAFLDDRMLGTLARHAYKLNLFNSNIATLTSIMFAKMPKVEADRRFADPNDDVARVASEMVTRILQNDMNDPEDRLLNVLKQALQDRLVPGLGAARVRYCLEEEGEGDAAVKTDEWCDIEYVHWRDILWSPCRTPDELRWVAFRAYMTRGEVEARFGPDVAKLVPYASRGPKLDPGEGERTETSQHQDAAQAEVWEIWDKASHRVYWYVKGFSKFLDVRDDPMKLAGFFPNAPCMVANVSTMKYLPKPDYLMARDLYEEINELESRIAMLTKACKAVGVYPASAKEIQRVLNEACENEMIPVEAWAMFADKGGLKGQIEYFPIKEVAETLQILVIQQQNRINQLYQVTGMSDIIRGQAATTGVTATEQKIKAQFASTRMQSFQDEFALFASNLLNLKVQLIRKYYDPERILKLSNILNTPDAQHAQAAVELIKDEDAFDCRVAVRAESMAQIDYEALKTERSEFLNGVASFLTAVGPVIEQVGPEAAPFLLELLKFNLAGMKGANAMEGVIDQAVAALNAKQQAEAAKPPEPSPEEKAAQIETQGKIQVEQAKAQATGAADQLRAQTDAQIAQQEHQLEMEKLQAEMQMQREKHTLEMEKLKAQIQMMFAKLGFEQQSQELELQGQQQEQAMDAEHAEREFQHDEQRMEMEDEHAERSFEREDEQAEARFKQESRHAEAAARRESKQPKGDK